MRIVILLTFFLASMTLGAQVYFVGDSIRVETPVPSNATDFHVVIQNADNLSESVWFWSDTGTGTFYAPWCNARVSRTMFDYDLVAHGEWSVELQKAPVSVKVNAMPNRTIMVEVTGGSFDVSTQHIAYGGKYLMYEQGMQHYPHATGQNEGQHKYFLPYRRPGLSVATITVHAGSCSQSVGRIFYLN